MDAEGGAFPDGDGFLHALESTESATDTSEGIWNRLDAASRSLASGCMADGCPSIYNKMPTCAQEEGEVQIDPFHPSLSAGGFEQQLIFAFLCRPPLPWQKDQPVRVSPLAIKVDNRSSAWSFNPMANWTTVLVKEGCFLQYTQSTLRPKGSTPKDEPQPPHVAWIYRRMWDCGDSRVPTGPDAGAEASPVVLEVGAAVEIHSLQKSPELNGVRGEIVQTQDLGTGRCGVKTATGKLSSSGQALFRVDNLEVDNLRLIEPGLLLVCMRPRTKRPPPLHAVGGAVRRTKKRSRSNAESAGGGESEADEIKSGGRYYEKMKKLRGQCWRALGKDDAEALMSALDQAVPEFEHSLSVPDGNVRDLMRMLERGLWKNSEGKWTEKEGGGQYLSFGLIAAAAANVLGVPRLGALKCLVSLLQRFSRDERACSSEQLQLASATARSLLSPADRTHALHLLNLARERKRIPEIGDIPEHVMRIHEQDLKSRADLERAVCLRVCAGACACAVRLHVRVYTPGGYLSVSIGNSACTREQSERAKML